MATNDPDLQTASPFARLPAELLRRITRSLSTTDLSAIRRTCKYVEHKMFASWSYELFRKRQLMVSTFSLQTLLEIARHEHLAPMLKHLCISTDVPVANYMVDQTASQALETARAVQDQQYLLNTGVWIEMLTEALKLLPNLETIDLRDFDSPSRFRDGEYASWHSYGSTTIFERTGARPSPHTSNMDRIFQGVVLAAGRAQVRAPNLEVITRTHGLHTAFYISPAVKPIVTGYLSGLTKLHLVLKNANTHDLESFLHLTPNVTWLRVNYMYNTDYEGPEKFLEWLSTPVNNETMDAYAKACADAAQANQAIPIAPLNLTLDSLELGSCPIRAPVLDSLVKKLKLRTLSLWRVSLCSDPNVKGDYPGADAFPGLWTGFLESLEGNTIRRLTVGHASESEVSGSWGRNVIFKGGFDKAILRVPNRRYSSEMFKRASEDCEVEKAPSRGPTPSTVDSDADNSDENDEDDDEENDDDGNGTEDE